MHFSMIRGIPLFLSVAIMLRCSPPPTISIDTPAEAVADDQAAARADSTAVPEQPLPIRQLTVEEWIGNRFVLLRIPPMFQKFGYELFTSRLFEADKSPLRADIENKNRRLLYHPFSGRIVIVTGIEPYDNEYLVTFSDSVSGRSVYARTHKGAVRGIAHADDLDEARNRWLGKTIYARKRHINTYDSISGVLGTIKVSIDEPLRVTGIQGGLSPMPPQPVWVIVTTPPGQEGIIPTFYSWTNVMSDCMHDRAPWDDDILETNPRERHSWDDETWDFINRHNLVKGMTRSQAALTWSAPPAVDTLRREDGRTLERWTFPAQYLHFSGDSLVEIVNR